MKALIFTKTFWEEPHRIRHEVASLLLECSFNVEFFEKPRFLLFRSKKPSSPCDKLTIVPQQEAIHHQLRFIRPLTLLNMFFQIKILREKHAAPKLIVNFNYDYFWLRNIFDNVPQIFIINDDFISMAKPWMKKEAKYAFEKTASNSDLCLAVSIPLLNKCKKYNSNSHLFLPWVDTSDVLRYKRQHQDRILYWGYINERIDFEIIHYLLSQGIKIDFIGPIINKKVFILIKSFRDEGLHYFPPIDFCKLQSCAWKYFASIIPYRAELPANQAITASNRLFKLLSLGFPVVISKLPYLIDAPSEIIYSYNNKKECLEILLHLRDKRAPFKKIKMFLSNHTKANRKEELIKKLNSIGISLPETPDQLNPRN